MNKSIAYAVTCVSFVCGDFVWLTQTSAFYQQTLHPLLAPSVRGVPAVLFYVIYLFGVCVFCVTPSLGRSWKSGVVKGALFGFVAYATYDMTNYATLKGWTLQITLMDLAWGSVLTASATTLGRLAGGAFAKRS